MQNLFYGWLDTIIIPQIPAKEKEKTQRNIKKRGGHLWASTFQIVKKVLSSRHVRMDRTHTGKFSAESVRGRKAECAVQR